MSEFQKGNLTVEGASLHMSMPFEKVDVKKRTVSGYATLDNVDTQGDIVLSAASKKAFARARGNIREMHKKDSAVGRLVDFREEKVADPDTGEIYNGIYVTARVSEGAQDTWLKVLDGTLSGFSIGGEINEASNEFNKDAGKTVRVISDYDLTELSLVDNPANQLANVTGFQKSVFSMTKAADGSVKSITGMVAETDIENVFICLTDDTVIVKSEDSADCPLCSNGMENAGWFENGATRTEKVKEIVSNFRSPGETEAAPDIAKSEGGVNMSKKDDDNTTEVQTPQEAAPPAPEGSPDEVHTSDPAPVFDGEDNAEAASVEEVTDDESEISKKISELQEVVKNTLEKSNAATGEKVAVLEQKIDEITAVFEKKASELESKINEFGEKLEVTKGRLAGFEKSLDDINSSDAFRKSADLDESAETVSKGTTVWNGAFSHTSLFKS